MIALVALGTCGIQEVKSVDERLVGAAVTIRKMYTMQGVGVFDDFLDA